jgi:hypothetical protein
MLIFYGIMGNADGNKAGGRGNLMAALLYPCVGGFSQCVIKITHIRPFLKLTEVCNLELTEVCNLELWI